MCSSDLLSVFSGNSGVMSFGHVMFMAAGAYTTAYLTIPVPLKKTLFADLPGALSWLAEVHSSFPVALVAGGLVAAVVGLVLAGTGYWAYWNFYSRFQPVTITRNQAQIQQLLDEASWVSGGGGGDPLYVIEIGRAHV